MRLLLFLMFSPVFAQDAPPPAPIEEVGAGDPVVVEKVASVEEPAEPVVEDDAAEMTAEVLEDELDVDEVVETVGLIKEAIDSGAWGLVVGLILSLLVAVSRRFNVLHFLPSQAVPWATMGLSLAASVAALLVGGVAVGEAILAGITAGLAAVGGWEMLLKHIKVLRPASVERLSAPLNSR